MSQAAVLAATAASVAALGYLAATDPKRRRVFQLPAPRRQRARMAWAAAIGPGAAVAAVAGAGGFFVWLGAVSVFGWALAAVRPGRAKALCGDVWRQLVKALRL